MFGRKGKRYAGNARRTEGIQFGPGSTSVELATAMAHATLPFSPAAAGIHNPSTQPRGYAMLPGYGVHRAGNDVGPLQIFYGAVAQVANAPMMPSAKLGIGAGVAGQPGMPQGGEGTGASIGWMSLGQLAPRGLGM